MNLAVFSYAFPHQKSQLGLLRLCLSGLRPALVIAQEAKQLPPNDDSLGVAPKDVAHLLPWRALLELLGLPHMVADHDSEESHFWLKSQHCDAGVILGARILRKPTIDLLPLGVLNMHPGVLPGNRGLDNLKRAILEDLDPAVTFHLIDHQIDAGRMLFIEPVELFATDTIQTVFQRHQKTELDGLERALSMMQRGLKAQPFDPGAYNQALGSKFDRDVAKKFPSWLKKRLK